MNIVVNFRTFADHFGCLLSDSRNYHAPLYPYRLIRISTDKIQHCPISTPSTGFFRPSPVVDGDWDKSLRKFNRDVVYKSFDAHFNDGVEWEQTEYYQFMRDQINSSGTYKGLRKEQQLVSRCKRLDDLYESIKLYGYKTQRELGGEKITDLDTEPFLPPERKEITVHVARDGEFLWAGGAHRLTIAKLLDVETVPVRISMRHRDWQAIRDLKYRGKSINPNLEEHPDLHFDT